MEADINEPKSVSFTVYLRCLQYGFQLLIAILLARFVALPKCESQFDGIALVISIILIIINILAILMNRCIDTFARCQFFTVFGLDIVMAGVILVLGITGESSRNTCGPDQVLNRFAFV